MRNIYLRTLPRSQHADAHYIQGYQNISEADTAALASADLVVWQMTQLEQRVPHISTGAPEFFVPLVICPFLWPLAGEPHPENPKPEFAPEGPYPAEIGDRFLNDMIRKRVQADEAARLWRETDFAAEKHVVRTLEITLDQQRSRDRVCGHYRVAEMIERFLPITPLFRTRGHLRPTLLKHMAVTLFNAVGLDDHSMEIIRWTDYEHLMPNQDAPIHPSISSEFGMYFVRQDTLYQYGDEGGFTAAEHVDRYMRLQWDCALSEGMWLFHVKRDPIAAYPLLKIARQTSPHSVACAHAFEHAEAAFLAAQKTA